MEYRAGMFVYALAFLLGVIVVQQLSILPSSTSLLLLAGSYGLVIVIGCFFIKYLQLDSSSYTTLIIVFISLFILGFTFSSLFAKQQLSYRLDEGFVGKNLLLSGYISNIPAINNRVQRFEFVVEKYRDIDSDGVAKWQIETTPRFPRKIRLSWYYGRTVSAAQKWQLEVRLKSPHGFINPGGFDYEGWLFQHGLHATGYVRKSDFNQQLASTDVTFLATVNILRQKISQQIDAVADQRKTDTPSFSLIKALAIGDKSSISKQQWRVLTATGTSHLMAISGLHIGLAALFAYVLMRRVVPVCVIKRLPAQHVALTGGLFVALLYALVAGFSVPTQRAFIMLLILSIMLLIRRNHRPVDALCFAMIVVLLIDPLAVLSAGFWFSFSAVAVIFISISSARRESSRQGSEVTSPLWEKIIAMLKQWVRLQFFISLLLLPLSLFMFQQVSLISPLANLLFIPYVSFVVVPVVLLAICFSFVSPEIAGLLFDLSATLLNLVWPVLSYFASQPYALWSQGNVGVIKLLSATTALCLLFFSRPIVEKITPGILSRRHFLKVYSSLLVISALMFMPVFFGGKSQQKYGEYRIAVLDVGQGSAAVLQTQNHVMVFDSGAKFSDKLDAGSSVVIPYLRAQGIKAVDSLIISHGDSDHIGGAQAIIDAYSVNTVIGQDIDNIIADGKQGCFYGLRWQWDGVDFKFLSPPKDGSDLLPIQGRNNQSCVLRVSSHSGTVLFTGDIEKKVEQQLLTRYQDQLQADILMVPHHGSKTSSSQDFITTVNPKISIFSVGYKNRYKLPSAKIISRYDTQGSEILRTDKSGAIIIQLTENHGFLVERYRDIASKYWHHVVN